MAESADETEGLSLEDSLETLKRDAKAVEVHYVEGLKQFKGVIKRISLDSGPVSNVPLQPKTRMMKWLTDRGLRVESTFIEFFEVFIEEHKKEHRLDLSKRTIQLNSAACILFGYKDINPTVHLYDVLRKVSSLYD